MQKNKKNNTEEVFLVFEVAEKSSEMVMKLEKIIKEELDKNKKCLPKTYQ